MVFYYRKTYKEEKYVKTIRSIIAIILLLTTLTGLSVKATDELQCTFDTSDLALELNDCYTVSGIVYSSTLHITSVTIDIFDPSGCYFSGCSSSIDGPGLLSFDMSDSIEICLSIVGQYLIRWYAKTEEGIGFSRPVEKRITVLATVDAMDDLLESEERAPLGSDEGDAQGELFTDTGEVEQPRGSGKDNSYDPKEHATIEKSDPCPVPSATPKEDQEEGDAASEISSHTSVFMDVSTADLCYGAIERVYQRGIISGTGGGNFSPNTVLTRAQAAALICKLLDHADQPQRKTKFSDVPRTHWASGYILFCAENGLLKGYGDGRFGPDDEVKLKQFAKLLISVIGYGDFAEYRGGYPEGYFRVACEIGVMNYVECPEDAALERRWAAVMLDNVLTYHATRLEESGFFDSPVIGNFSDGSNVYIQTQDKWADDTYGFDSEGKAASFYNSACGVFALANAISAVTGRRLSDNDVREIAAFSVQEGYRVNGSGTKLTLVTGYAEQFGTELGFRAGEPLFYSKGGNADVIRSINNVLDAGGALVFSVKSSSGGHIMAIVNRRLNSDGQSEYLLLDSYASSNRLGKGVNEGWVTMDAELDLKTDSGKTIVTKAGSGFGFYPLYPG